MYLILSPKPFLIFDIQTFGKPPNSTLKTLKDLKTDALRVSANQIACSVRKKIPLHFFRNFSIILEICLMVCIVHLRWHRSNMLSRD